ncbi:hypothetical protein SAMN05216571_108125 [Onishia taeanensis]|uniref:Uncharacterized protein n=1 Tax=Onishia taeanensis TaxID=284577 RepID=A0A1G7T202_9GAMM|nr:hypothetical protein [Halomonas taeanensis]SDG29357.1 hypothetical protein SAMN05216571_108125 [Halomonas taeanensis]
MRDGASKKKTLKGAGPGHGWLGVLSLALLFVLAGCEGSSTPPASDANEETASAQAQVSSSPADTSTDSPEQPEALTEPVTVTVTTQLTDARRLQVTGRTNLPDRARLLVVLEREASGVNWQMRTEVDDGQFTAGPLGPGSGLIAGRYLIRVSMPAADVQPSTVKARIGARGEHLAGPLVARSPHGLGNVIEYRQEYQVEQ